MLNFSWNLINTEHFTDEQLEQVQYAIEIRAYTCQRRIEEEEFDISNPGGICGDCINLFVEAIDEAYVVAVGVSGDQVDVDLDCSLVVME